MIKGILDGLELRVPDAKQWVRSILANEGQITGISELENDGIVYWVVKSCATVPLNQTGEQNRKVKGNMWSLSGRFFGIANLTLRM
jgi:hypothetical protein